MSEMERETICPRPDLVLTAAVEMEQGVEQASAQVVLHVDRESAREHAPPEMADVAHESQDDQPVMMVDRARSSSITPVARSTAPFGQQGGHHDVDGHRDHRDGQCHDDDATVTPRLSDQLPDPAR